MSALVNDSYLELTPYIPGRSGACSSERRAVNLASNENPLGPSQRALAAAQQVLVASHRYPDPTCHGLKSQLADRLGVSEAQLLVGNGSGELIEMLVRACLRPGETCLVADPSFVMYTMAPRAVGAEVVAVPTRGLRCDLEAMADAVDARTKIIFIANPNNPTGTYVTTSELDAFVARVPEHVLIVVDEAYAEYVVAPDYPNAMLQLPNRERLVVLRTFSKCHGLAALRVGYGVTHPTLADYVERARQPFNVNTVGQAAAAAALADEDHVAMSVAVNRSEMAKVSAAMARLGADVVPSQANFVLADVHQPAAKVAASLLSRGVLVRPMGSYGLPTSLRVTVGRPGQNRVFADALAEVLRPGASAAL